jgi:hypothetical protein
MRPFSTTNSVTRGAARRPRVSAAPAADQADERHRGRISALHARAGELVNDADHRHLFSRRPCDFPPASTLGAIPEMPPLIAFRRCH